MKGRVTFSLVGFWLIMLFCFGPITSTYAQAFPDKNITWFVGYKPGGGFDTYSRVMARHMERYLPKGIHVVVINKPGSASQIAASMIYNSRPDGYTVGILPMPGLYVPQMFFKTNYDVRKMTWIGTILKEPMCLAISAKSKYRAIKELQEAESVRIPLTGFTGPEIAAPITMEALGIKARYITGHRGSKEAMLAALRGDGDVVVFTYGSLRKFILKKSFIPVLLLGSTTRIPAIKDVPTATEVGHPLLDEVISAWRVIGGPPRIPEERAEFLRGLFMKTAKDPDFLKWSESAKRPVSPLDGMSTQTALEKVMAKYEAMKELFSRYIK